MSASCYLKLQQEEQALECLAQVLSVERNCKEALLLKCRVCMQLVSDEIGDKSSTEGSYKSMSSKEATAVCLETLSHLESILSIKYLDKLSCSQGSCQVARPFYREIASKLKQIANVLLFMFAFSKIIKS